MLKYSFILLMLGVVLSCNRTGAHKSLADSLHMADSVVKPIAGNRMIVPGKCVGLTFINENADSVIGKNG